MSIIIAVSKLMMNDFRLGMVAEINEYPSSICSHTKAGIIAMLRFDEFADHLILNKCTSATAISLYNVSLCTLSISLGIY